MKQFDISVDIVMLTIERHRDEIKKIVERKSAKKLIDLAQTKPRNPAMKESTLALLNVVKNNNKFAEIIRQKVPGPKSEIWSEILISKEMRAYREKMTTEKIRALVQAHKMTLQNHSKIFFYLILKGFLFFILFIIIPYS